MPPDVGSTEWNGSDLVKAHYLHNISLSFLVLASQSKVAATAQKLKPHVHIYIMLTGRENKKKVTLAAPDMYAPTLPREGNAQGNSQERSAHACSDLPLIMQDLGFGRSSRSHCSVKIPVLGFGQKTPPPS